MNHNLVPPSILSEAVLEVDAIPKKRKLIPSIEDHSIYFKEVNIRTRLQLHVTFSYFPSYKPSDTTLNDNEVKC